jgi:putative restriction endonuclease
MNEEILQYLRRTNYVRQARPNNNYWVDFYEGRLNTFIQNYGNNFNIIIHAPINNETRCYEDYYIIPFSRLTNLLLREVEPQGGRWIIHISNHSLIVAQNSIDVEDFFNIDIENLLVEEFYLAIPDNANRRVLDLYRRMLTNVRTRQSDFRQNVLENFDRMCCITGIREETLLIASHIIPYSLRNNAAIDTNNGLCLSVLYDKLFDKGYFTLINDNEELRIQVINDLDALSEPLRNILNEIRNRPIRRPRVMINAEYIEYHRSNIFIDRLNE